MSEITPQSFQLKQHGYTVASKSVHNGQMGNRKVVPVSAGEVMACCGLFLILIAIVTLIIGAVLWGVGDHATHNIVHSKVGEALCGLATILVLLAGAALQCSR